MASSPRTTGFWWFQATFWSITGTLLFISGATQMALLQALVRNLYLLVAGFMSSFFLAMIIDQLRSLSLIRVRAASYALAYVIALFCVVVINAISFTQQGASFGELTFGQWFSGTMNFALVYAFWSELFIQRIYVDKKRGPAAEVRPDRLVVDVTGPVRRPSAAQFDPPVAPPHRSSTCHGKRIGPGLALRKVIRLRKKRTCRKSCCH